jgi:hypothetical protein
MCNYIILANNNKYLPLPPAVPTASATVQPTCATPSGTINTTQSGVEYSVNGTAYQSSNSFAGLLGVILYMSETFDPSCVTISGSTTTINSIPPPPVVPTTASVTQQHVLCNLEVVLPRNQELNIV